MEKYMCVCLSWDAGTGVGIVLVYLCTLIIDNLCRAMKCEFVLLFERNSLGCFDILILLFLVFILIHRVSSRA